MSLKTIVGCFAIALSLLGLPTKGDADAPPIIKVLTLNDQLTQVFGEEAHLMKAIAMAESNLEERQVSHNRRKDGSTWSVDCGVLQVNVKGKVCPPHLLTVSGNLQAAKKIKDEQGLRAWVVYKRKLYLKYM